MSERRDLKVTMPSEAMTGWLWHLVVERRQANGGTVTEALRAVLPEFTEMVMLLAAHPPEPGIAAAATDGRSLRLSLRGSVLVLVATETEE